MYKRNHFRKTQQKRYTSRLYKNPYFRTSKEKKGKGGRKLPFIPIAIGGFVVLFLSLTGFFLSAVRFSYTNIEVRGLHPSSNEKISTQVQSYLSASRFFFFHKDNRFLFSKKDFISALEDVVSFDEVNVVTKKQTIFLTVKERSSDFIWKSGSNLYLAERKGILIQQTQEIPSDQPLPLFIDKNATARAVGDRVLPEGYTETIFQFIQELSALPFTVQNVQIDEQMGKWVGIQTGQGFLILIDPEQGAAIQFERLKTVLKQTIQDTAKLQYVDLRFGDHVYFK